MMLVKTPDFCTRPAALVPVAVAVALLLISLMAQAADLALEPAAPHKSATVPDAGGAEGSDQITLTVNAVPVVAIVAPADGSLVGEGDVVQLTGTAADLESGDLSASLDWSSSLDGVI